MRNLLLLTALLGLLAWSGCKKPCEDPTDPDCVNYCFDPTDPNCDGYDPCTAETPVSAEFRIIENGTWGYMKLLDTVYYDTVRSTDLISEALHIHDDWTYTWYIGTETYDGPERSLDYSSAPKGIPVSITLVVEGPPNTACFPDDDGRDTVSRQVVFTDDRFFQSLFHGYLNGEETDTVTLGFQEGGLGRLMFMVNFKPGCIYDQQWSGTATYRKFLFEPGGTYKCDRPEGVMIRDPEKTGDFERVRCEYTLTAPGEGVTHMVFEGRRILR